MQGEVAIIDEDYDVTPKLGMEFQTIDEAWSFWNFYGGRKGFSARKGKEYKKDDVLIAKAYFCNCAGKRVKDKRDHLTKDPRAETRTDCQVYMRVRFERKSQTYKVVRFVSEHNHPLHKPEARYLMRSQRKVSQVAAIDIQLADSSGIRPKAAYELNCRQGGGVQSIGYTEVDHNNCLRDQRKEVMKYGSNRNKEIKADFNMTSKLPKIKLNFPILRDAGKPYTPKVFELFQAEFELVGSAHIEGQEGNTYKVGTYDIENDTQHKSRQVTWNRDDQTISCSCKKFEREGILCYHALKILDREDIKVVPPRYILEGRSVVGDAMLEIRNRNAKFFRIVTPTFAKAFQNEERAQYLNNELLAVVERYEKKYEHLPRTSGEVNPMSQDALHLKKKIGGDKRSKRNHPWNEKLANSKKGKRQDDLRPSTNLSQDASKNIGCYVNLEDLHNVEIIQD